MNDTAEPGSAAWIVLEVKKIEASNAALTEAIYELIKVMKAPVTRHSSIDLPSGKASMTVKESKA